jgi:hypothetical protein
LDVLYGGLRISKLEFLIPKKIFKKISAVCSSSVLVIKIQNNPGSGLDSLEMLDPDPDSMNLDPQLCMEGTKAQWYLVADA